MVVGRVVSVDPRMAGQRVRRSVDRVGGPRQRQRDAQGRGGADVDVEVEGGTIGTLTLRVSDQVSFAPGERATFFVRRNRRGKFVPHLRGQGLLKLDTANRVPGSSLTLDRIRREVAAGKAR